jgi:hypothetical protein
MCCESGLAAFRFYSYRLDRSFWLVLVRAIKLDCSFEANRSLEEMEAVSAVKTPSVYATSADQRLSPFPVLQMTPSWVSQSDASPNGTTGPERVDLYGVQPPHRSGPGGSCPTERRQVRAPCAGRSFRSPRSLSLAELTVVLEPVEGDFGILANLDEIAVRIAHVAAPLPAVIVLWLRQKEGSFVPPLFVASPDVCDT